MKDGDLGHLCSQTIIKTSSHIIQAYFPPNSPRKPSERKTITGHKGSVGVAEGHNVITVISIITLALLSFRGRTKKRGDSGVLPLPAVTNTAASSHLYLNEGRTLLPRLNWDSFLETEITGSHHIPALICRWRNESHNSVF